MNYLNTIDRYRDYRPVIHNLLASSISSLGEEWQHSSSDEEREKSLAVIAKNFPFISTLFVLDEAGSQVGDTLISPYAEGYQGGGDGIDRSRRPYFSLAQGSGEPGVTEPYLSVNSRALCISAVTRLAGSDSRPGGYLVLDVDLNKILSFFMGDTQLRRVEWSFKAVYLLISVGLFLVVFAMLWHAASQLFVVLTGLSDHQAVIQVFRVVIYLTLALAIFDLGKTTLEEEVLLGKDVFRHSSTRRTITRFIAAILIAISIEALMMIFKAAFGTTPGQLTEAVWVMMPAVGLLIGLGLYVYLGARAEQILLETRRSK